MPTRSTRRLLVAGAALATLGALTSCSAHPGAAAVVGSESISTEEVDALAGTLCSTQTGGQQGQPQLPVASRPAREGALDILVSTSLSQQFGDDVGVEPDQEQVSAALAAQQTTLDLLTESEQEVFTDALREFVAGQLMLIEVGREELAEQGTTAVDQQQALDEGTQLRDAWVADNLDVDVDPRYGRFSGGRFVPGSGSVSVAVSGEAKDAVAEQPSDDWVSSLPASQQCG